MTEEVIIYLFEVNGKELIPTRHCYGLKFLKVIMDKYPDDYIDVYKYIFYMSCPDPVHNPYFNLKDVLREEKIIRDNDFRFYTQADEITNAVEKCKDLYETPTLKAHKAIKRTIENLYEYMSQTNFVGGEGGNIKDFMSLTNKFDELKEKYLNTTKELHQEQKTLEKRGGGQLAYDLNDRSSRDDD